MPKDGTMWFPGDPQIFCKNTTCRYHFREISTRSLIDDELNPVIITTSRYLDAPVSCRSWPVRKGGDGAATTVTVATDSGVKEIEIPLPIGVNTTIFLTNVTENCGFGCSQLSALETSATNPWYYECNSTVGNVTNAVLPEHHVSDRLATMASRAIALEGDAVSSLTDDTRAQYQTYPAESVFGTPGNGTSEFIELLISRFSIGVVAAAAQYNSVINVMGKAPAVGEGLSVKHPDNVVIILVLIVALQLILDIGFAWVSNKVVVPHGGVIAISEVLRPMTGQRDARPGVEISKEGGQNNRTEGLWKYSCRKISDDRYDLHMTQDRDSPDQTQ